YANANRKSTIAIYHGAVKVNEMQVAVSKGYNEVDFNLNFSKKGLKSFEKATKNSKIKAAQNGVSYLPKGKYTIKIGTESRDFEIK
ncbi:hypothetical protein, partial [Polaribacter sp.]|uniref:hypothetical protein n=1 Tax=Polaribacter sp. TaxID=1920175 RepID=UPI003F6A484F